MVYFRELDDELCEILGLSFHWRWKGLFVEWFGRGIVLWAKPTEPRYG